jgi:putative transposase
MLRVKKNLLRATAKQYKFLRHLSRASKNLYNATLYLVRQHYFNCGEYLDHVQAYFQIREEEVYKSLPSDPAQQTMKMVDRAFKSFFGLLRAKRNGQYNEPISPPKYLDKNGYFALVFPCREGRMKDQFRTLVPKHLQEKFGFKQFVVAKPEQLAGKTIKEVRIIPRVNHFEIEWVYEEEPQPQELDNKRTLGIDLGVNNFAACVDSKSGRSFILDGRKIKSLNRYFNKRSARMMPKSKNKRRAWDKRNRIFNDILNQYVNVVVQYCLANKIGNVVIGQGYLAPKDKSKVFNQNFAFIPFGRFCFKLKSKCEMYGINYSSINEAYTSKCDHLAGEEMCHHEKYLGKRVHRGLFKSSTGVVLNADVNGGLGMIVKSKHKVDVNHLVSSGCLTQPRIITLDEIHRSGSIQVVRRLAV